MTSIEILAHLRAAAPNLAFVTERTINENYRWDGAKKNDPAKDGYDAYDVDVTAICILGGQMLFGEASLGGCYMLPEEPIGDIGGYLPQKLEEVAKDLRQQLQSQIDKCPQHRMQAAALLADCIGVQMWLKEEMRARWQAQQDAKVKP